MNSNLKTAVGFKDLLLKKLSYAVMCSVLSHMIVILLYIIVVNFNTDLYKWFGLTFNTLTSLSTWLYLISFASIIFAQIVICAKDYVLPSTCEFTRFQKFLSVFSFRIFILGLLYVVLGGVAVWLYISLSGDLFDDTYAPCKEDNYCFVQSTFFLILGGVWTGLYFFVRCYVAHKNPIFPVIQQRKLLHFKARFLPLLNESKNKAFYPTLSYFLFNYFFGGYVRHVFAQSFKLRLHAESFSYWYYTYVWIFAMLYIVNMNLMQFFFELFLTEPIEHPLITMDDNDSSLSQALVLNNMPILQHLACLDLYLMSMWSSQRRQQLYTLSQPGGHPHTWNHLIRGGIQLLDEFTDTLNRSIELLLRRDEAAKVVENKQPILNKIEPFSPISTKRFPTSTMRKLHSPIIVKPDQIGLQDRTIILSPSMILEKLLARIKNLSVIKYVFGELPEAHIQQCLKNGQLIMWTTQGLSNVAAASFYEDPYGIVQKDLPILLNSLFALKSSVDKLNKLPALKKGSHFDSLSLKMKSGVSSACKRSIFNLYKTFGNYLSDIPLKMDSHYYRL